MALGELTWTLPPVAPIWMVSLATDPKVIRKNRPPRDPEHRVLELVAELETRDGEEHQAAFAAGACPRGVQTGEVDVLQAASVRR